MDNETIEDTVDLTEPAAAAEDAKPAKKKTRFWRGFFTGILATIVILVMVVGGMLAWVTHELSGSSSGESAQTGVVRRSFDYQAIDDKLAVLKRVADRYFLYDYDTDDLETGIYRGMIDALDDPYTVYYTPKEYEEMTVETTGEYYGIGALVSQNIDTGMVTVLRVFTDSPAEKAGIMKGDIFYKVNGIEAATQDLDLLVSEQVRGEAGTTVNITIIRGDEEIELEVVRGPVQQDTVYSEMLSDGKTGYILVGQFDVVTAGQFEEAVDELESLGMTQLVIDLRDNPGGVLDTAVSMAAYILPDDTDMYDGTIIYTADKNGRGDRYYFSDGEIYYESGDGSVKNSAYPKKDGHEVDIPIAILVNENSASASEVFSGALRDYGVARLVGTKTFGKGVVQGLYPLTDGSAVKITISRYYTPSGFDLDGEGLEPDLEVEYEVPEDIVEDIDDLDDLMAYDNQIAAAVKLLDEE